MRSLGFAVAILLVVSNWVGAAPLNLAQVSADARWLVLVDVDGMRTAPGWRKAHEEFWETNKSALGPILDIAGLDLKNGLHGVTIYAAQIATEKKPMDFRGAAIVSLDFDLDKLGEKLKMVSGGKSIAHGSHQIYQWETSTGGDNKQTLSIALHPSKAVVISNSTADAERALDVLDGTAPNITQTDSSLTTAVPLGTLLLARGLDMDKIAAQFESPLLRQSESLSLAIGEHDQQTFADGQARLKSADTAQQIEALVNGFRALIQLQTANQDDVTKWLSRVQCVRSDKVVTLSLRLPTDELKDILKIAGGSGLKTTASTKIQIGSVPPVDVDVKPGTGIKYKFGVQFGTQPPAVTPAEKSSKEAK